MSSTNEDPERRTNAKCAPDPADVDPAGQSPEDPIEFCVDDEVARGNAQRANAEPEPAALHAAEVPGKPDVADRRRKASQDDQ
jgi:hypothetical protein